MPNPTDEQMKKAEAYLLRHADHPLMEQVFEAVECTEGGRQAVTNAVLDVLDAYLADQQAKHEAELRRVREVLESFNFADCDCGRESADCIAYNTAERMLAAYDSATNSTSGITKPAMEDELYEDAKKAVTERGFGSTPILQRELKIGHARAERLLNLLSLNGVVGPENGARPRKLLAAFDEAIKVKE